MRSVRVFTRPIELRKENVTGVAPLAASVSAKAPLAFALHACHTPPPMRTRQRALASETVPLTRTPAGVRVAARPVAASGRRSAERGDAALPRAPTLPARSIAATE